MLSDNDAVATVAVRVSTARGSLRAGARVDEDHGERGSARLQDRKIHAVRLPFAYAGTNKATAVTWVADEVEDIVTTLKGRGVNFEHYDLPNMTRQGDLHVAGTMKAAWFKDPDGNIFSLVTPPDTASRQTVGASGRSTA